MSKFVPYGMLTFCKNCGEQNPYHRELSDEEIMEIYDREELYNIDEGQMYLKPIEFAKELLKKASEK